jgi:apolipoprotein N-acyltransferase
MHYKQYEVKVNKKYVLLSVLSGVLMAFSFPNFIEMGLKTHTFFLIWLAYAPIAYVLIKEASKIKLFFYGVISWAVFYLIGLYWLCNVKPMGIGAYVSWIMLSLYLALFMGAILALARFLKEKAGVDWLFGLPAAFTVLEFAREWLLSGFQLLTPAQSLRACLPDTFCEYAGSRDDCK